MPLARKALTLSLASIISAAQVMSRKLAKGSGLFASFHYKCRPSDVKEATVGFLWKWGETGTSTLPLILFRVGQASACLLLILLTDHQTRQAEACPTGARPAV